MYLQVLSDPHPWPVNGRTEIGAWAFQKRREQPPQYVLPRAVIVVNRLLHRASPCVLAPPAVLSSIAQCSRRVCGDRHIHYPR